MFPGTVGLFATRLSGFDINDSWASRIRTYEMTESESVALPLGYSPIVRDGFLSVTNCYYTDGICGLQALFYSQSNGPTG